MLMRLLRSQVFALAVMTLLVVAALIVGHYYFGGLGVMFVGIVGLTISMRAEVFEGYSDPHERSSADVVRMYAIARDNRRFDGPDAVHKEAAESRQRHTFHRAVNAVFGAITVAGLGLLLF